MAPLANLPPERTLAVPPATAATAVRMATFPGILSPDLPMTPDESISKLAPADTAPVIAPVSKLPPWAIDTAPPMIAWVATVPMSCACAGSEATMSPTAPQRPPAPMPPGTCTKLSAPAMNASRIDPPAANVRPALVAAQPMGPVVAQATMVRIALPIVDRAIALATLTNARAMALKMLPIDLNNPLRKNPLGSVKESGLLLTPDHFTSHA